MQILVSRAGQQYGPYSEGEVREYVQSGRLGAEDLAWTEGRPNWVPLSQLVALGATAAPPPISLAKPSPSGPPPLQAPGMPPLPLPMPFPPGGGAFPGVGQPKRSLLLPIIIGAVVLCAIIGIALLAVLGAAFATPEKLALTYAETIKPSILTEWHKKPELQNATIQKVTLTPVNGSRTTFTGTVDATIDGEKIRFPVEASVDAGSSNVRWKVLPVAQ